VPLYDYDCAACGTRFEVVHGVHADPPTTCPVCGKGPVKKAFSAPTIHFKGSGWAKKERSAKPAATKSSDGEKSGPPTAAGGGEPAKTEASKPAGPAASEA